MNIMLDTIHSVTNIWQRDVRGIGSCLVFKLSSHRQIVQFALDMTGEKQHNILNLWYLNILYLCRLEEDEKINDTLQIKFVCVSMKNKLWEMWQKTQVANF